MIPFVESEQALTGEAFAILRRNLPPHKIARLLSMWRIGEGDYVKERNALFAGETVESLFKQAEGPGKSGKLISPHSPCT